MGIFPGEIRVVEIRAAADGEGYEIVAAGEWKTRHFRIGQRRHPGLYHLFRDSNGTTHEVLFQLFKTAFPTWAALEAELYVLTAKTNREMRSYEMLRAETAPADRDWLDKVESFVPKAFREPWMGDLREDRLRMEQAGRGRLFVEFATTCQLLWLAVATLWDSFKETIWRSLRIS